MQVSKDMAILDLGCGTGWLVEKLRLEGYNAVGIDPNLPASSSRSYLLRRNAYDTEFDPYDNLSRFIIERSLRVSSMGRMKFEPMNPIPRVTKKLKGSSAT